MAYTLLLVSASASRGEPDNCDLVFNLDVQQLPDFSKREIWKDSVGSPLRDRLMIDWLFSHSSAQEQLDLMISEINRKFRCLLPAQDQNEVDRDQPPANLEPLSSTLTNSSTAVVGLNEAHGLCGSSPSSIENAQLLVGIVCHNGVHHSPCFVEKLRDMYQRDRTYNKLLVIQTQHWDISSKSHGKKQFVWQRTKIPTRYVRDIEVFTNARVWVSLDVQVGSECEQVFLQDPYCSVLPDEVNVVDFESGTLFDKAKRKSYLIRSTNIKHGLLKNRSPPINCRFVGNEAYKKAVKRYDAAGILFYSVHPVTGEAVFLLGHMTYSCESWCDFGGLKSWRKFKERARQAAARECYEETLGILGSASVLQHQLEDYKTNNVFKVVNEVYYYVSHFLRVPFRDYPEIFQAEASLPGHSGRLEIDEIRWFSLAAMRESVKMALDNQAAIAISYINKDGTACSGTNRLRVEFVHTLCIADKLGILDSIEYITKQLHISSQPPPPRPVSFPKPRHVQPKFKSSKDIQAVPSGTQLHVPEVSQSMHQARAESTKAQIHGCKEEDIHTDHSNDTSTVVTDSESKTSTRCHVQGSPRPESTSGNSLVCSGLGLSDTGVPSSAENVPDSLKKLQLEDFPGDSSMGSLDELADHRLHSQDNSIDCEMLKESRDSLSLRNETKDPESSDDMETRSRMWSFEGFLTRLSPDQRQEQKETKDNLSSEHEDTAIFSLKGSKLRHRKGKSCSDKTGDGSGARSSAGKKKGKSNPATMYNGRAVLYYGMGAGTFGV